MKSPARKPRIPIGLRLLAIFFAFGACMCALTIVLLLAPGTALDRLWDLNPIARAAFQTMGGLSILLMCSVGAACTAAAIGLARGAIWGKRLAILILTVNLIGDLANAFLRHDFRSLIGLPIAGGMIFYLLKIAVAQYSKPRARLLRRAGPYDDVRRLG